MIRTLSHGLIGLLMMFSGIFAATLIPSDTVAARGCESRFLTFPAWYNGVTKSDCTLNAPNADSNGTNLGKFIWRIVLNVIEIALQIIAYASAGYLIYGGFKYLTSSGSPDKTTAARKTIMNAIIGLIISFFSVVIVTLIARNIR